MNDNDKIQTFLASAGMLMEDVSVRMILAEQGIDERIAALRQVIEDLTVIADTVEIIQRRRHAQG